MRTQTYIRSVSPVPTLIFSRPANQVCSVLVRAMTDVEISLGGPVEVGRGLTLYVNESYGISRQDLPNSSDNFEIWASTEVSGVVSVTEVAL